MTREQKYVEQMKQLGIYQEIFSPEIRTLAALERDLQRLTKRWKEDGCPTVDQSRRAGPATSDKTLDAIMSLRKEILAHRDALGLTPKGLNRLKVKISDDGAQTKTDGQQPATILELVREKFA